MWYALKGNRYSGMRADLACGSAGGVLKQVQHDILWRLIIGAYDFRKPSIETIKAGN